VTVSTEKMIAEIDLIDNKKMYVVKAGWLIEQQSPRLWRNISDYLW
jgi:hypothetical protein